jgi:hypothetical protein
MHKQTDAEASQTVTKTHKPTCVFCGFERTGGNVLSAAPDLLVALKAVMACDDELMMLNGRDPDQALVDRLDAAFLLAESAVAKAEGRV